MIELAFLCIATVCNSGDADKIRLFAYANLFFWEEKCF